MIWYIVVLLKYHMFIRKRVIGSNIHDIEMWVFHSLWIVFLETSWRFDLSSRSLGHVMFSFAGNAKKAGAGYTEWALVVPKEKAKTSPTSTNKGNTRPPSIGLPYVQGLSERLSKTLRQHGVSVYHKPVNTLRSILVRQDAERQEVWGHMRDNMRSGPCTRVYRWNKTPTWKTLQGTHQPDHTNRCWWPLQCHRTLCFTWQHQSANQRATMDQMKRERSHIHKEKCPVNEPWTGIQLPPINHQLLLPEHFPRKKTSRDQGF